MNPPTRSEELFKKYCADQSYRVEKIPEGVEKAPDFKVITPHGTVIAEIKELCANPEESNLASGNGKTLCKRIGKRVGEKIKQAMQKKSADKRSFQVVVLFDNIVVAGDRPLRPDFYFNPEDIAFGMYGELETTILIDKSTGKLVGTRNDLGKNRYLRLGRGQEISAICVLRDIFDRNTPFLYTYHSVFALNCLPRQIFSGPHDKHFRNPADGNTFTTEWVEF